LKISFHIEKLVSLYYIIFRQQFAVGSADELIININEEIMQKFLEKCFHLKENNTTVNTELTAGLTTFLAMAYILAVNPNILG